MFFVGVFSNLIPIIILGVISLGLYFNGIENNTIVNTLEFFGYSTIDQPSEDFSFYISDDETVEKDFKKTPIFAYDFIVKKRLNKSYFCTHTIFSFFFIGKFGSRAPPQIT